MAQQVTAILSLCMVNMMSSDDRCFVHGKKGYIGHYCPDMQCYNCNGWGHFAQDCPKKISSSEKPHHHDRSHAHFSYNAETGHTASITDTGKGTNLKGQDHTIDLNMTEAPVTIGDTHSFYHTTAVAHNIHPQTDTLEGTPTGIPHTVTDTPDP